VVVRQNASPRLSQPVSREQVADLRLAAAQMTGAKRRALQAERTEQYGRGNARQAERLFGWGRETLEVGLAERRPGITCRGAQSVFSGRPRWEDPQPQAAAALRSLAEAQAQPDPTFRPPLAYTRLTANAAVAALRAQGFTQEHVPAPSTRAPVLKRLGFRLRKVLKAKPQKKLAQTEASFENIKKRRVRDRRGHRQTLEPRG
jgi:hypothetical protein